MDYYFFLESSNLKSELTLSNFPCSDNVPWKAERGYVCVATVVEGQWHIQTVDAIKPFDSIHLKGEDLVLRGPLSRTVVFLSYSRIEGVYDELPSSSDFESVPQWRGNISLISPTTRVSYQGEYPQRMLNTEKGSVVSIGALHQIDDNIRNVLYFVNFNKRPISTKGSLFVSRYSNKELILETEISTNKVNRICLDNMNHISDAELLLVGSKNILGIPVYFSHSLDNKFLSLEHTHPPHEVLAFGQLKNRFSIIRSAKKMFLEKYSI